MVTRRLLLGTLAPAAAAARLGMPAIARAADPRPLLMIDPGHGGKDPGCTGINGVQEKDITLKVGIDLRRALEATGRVRVQMTRTRDVYITLSDRVDMAIKAHANAFISLHCNHLADPAERGALIFTLSEHPSDALAARIARVIRDEARRASAELAERRGAFSGFNESVFAGSGPPLRNAQLTSVAPTGTISLIAGTTSGIEPMFALSYIRDVLGRRLVEANPRFERVARDRGFYSEELLQHVANVGGVRSNPAVPEDVRAAFVTAHEIAPAWHLRMQAAVQRHVDAAVSKTVNLPATASVEDVRGLLLDAWKAGAKGITVYRYGSRPDEVLSLIGDSARGAAPIRVGTDFTGGCAGHSCEY